MRCSSRTVSYQLGSQSDISWLLTLEQQMLEEGALKLYGRHDWKLHSFLGHQEPGLHSPHHARVTPLHRAGPGIVPEVPWVYTLLTFMGDTVHRPLVRGVKGGEGATG